LTETLNESGRKQAPPDASPSTYRAHPLLDPRLPSRHPSVARLWLDTWRRVCDDPSAYEALVSAYTHTAGGAPLADLSFDQYFHDADAYLNDLLRLVPASSAKFLAPLPETRGLSSLRDLLWATFQGPDRRVRYEAQRKLYLAKLLFDVDHTRSIRDGPRHRAIFERVLDRALWERAMDGQTVEVCGLLRDERNGSQRFEVGVPATPQARCWKFRVRRIPEQGRDAGIDVYHYRSRFKREADPVTGSRADDGLLRIAESPRWPGLGRRSGSILSKMIRRGIDDPRLVQDVLGAMFIVGNRAQAYALERRLVRALGGPLRWRDRVDTLRGGRDRDRLDRHSSSGFQVLKGIADVLMDDPASESPYLISVEVQIYPLEAYLRTLYDEHFASHAAYKRRQFLHDLLPALFPEEIYGSVTALAGLDANGDVAETGPV
jgi:hypothetical protein